ncbi:MAG: hypothetical protein H0T75_09030 [Rhizobiales bacterium]|nr:hypothetical protein [Hyphomicrobiales bacterium]
MITSGHYPNYTTLTDTTGLLQNGISSYQERTGVLLLLGTPLLDALERRRYGGAVLDTSGQIIAKSMRQAQRLFCEELGLERDAALEFGAGREATKRLLARGQRSFRVSDDHWVVVPRELGRPLVLHAVLLAETSVQGPRTALVLIDLDEVIEAAPSALERILRTEAKLAIEIVKGRTPAEIAEASGLAVATVRSQLGSAKWPICNV